MSKTAYITGGSKGIGLAIVQSLLEDGYNVGFSGTSRRSVDEGLAHIDDQYESKVRGFVTNVVDLAAQQADVDQLVKHYGSVDLVVANAGVGHFAAVDEMTSEQWQSTIDINLTGVFNTTKASIDALKVSKGYLITIASLAGTNFFEKGAAYNASKFGLVGFTQAVMMDLRRYDIKVTTIMPGSVATNFNGHTPNPEDYWKIQPEDIGQMVVDLTKMHPRTLPSKVEVRPTVPASLKK